MNYFDLHCDTLTESYDSAQELFHNNLNLSLEKTRYFDSYAQLFAVFLPDDIMERKGVSGMDYFKKVFRFFLNQAEKNRDKMTICKTSADLQNSLEYRKTAAILSIENLGMITSDPKDISVLSEYGVKAATLTWNAENELGGGAATRTGLTEKGKALIPVLEKNNIALDVSHLSEVSFWDAVSISKKPIIASHSNSFSVCPHERNLTDMQFLHIIKTGGIVGINLYPPFLSEKDAGISDILRHIEHYLSLSGEKSIAIGADFDGMPCLLPEISGISDISQIKDAMCHAGFSSELIDDLFFNNATRFFAQNINQ